MIFRVYFWLCFFIDFLMLFEAFWEPFWETLKLISVSFFDFTNKCAHRGFIAHGGEIKGPAAEQASNKTEKMEGQTIKKQAWKNNDFLSIFA